MFFILSKVLGFLIPPFNWLILWIFLALVLKSEKWKKRFKWVAVCWFLFFSNPYIIHQLNLQWQVKPREMEAGETYSAGIVLGGFVQHDAKNNKAYFSDASDRFLQAVRLYKKGHIQKILVSGGSGKIFYQQYKDADFAKEQLLEFGVDSADILIENQSRNTFENADFSKRVLDSAGIKGPYLLITSAMHIRRAEKVFLKKGVPVQAYPAHISALDFPIGFPAAIIPSINSLNSWENLLKEFIGLQVYKLTGKA